MLHLPGQEQEETRRSRPKDGDSGGQDIGSGAAPIPVILVGISGRLPGTRRVSML